MTRGEEGGNDPWSAPPFQEGTRLERLFPSELETSARPRGWNARSSRAHWSLRGPSRTEAEYPQPRFNPLNPARMGPRNERHHRLRQAGLALPCKQDLGTCDTCPSRGRQDDFLRDTGNTLARGALKMGMGVNVAAT